MADVTLSQVETDLGNKILESLKTQLNATWGTLQVEVVKELELCAKTAAKLALRAIQGEDVSTLQLHLKAQVANLLVVAEGNIISSFWTSVHSVVGLAGKVLSDFTQQELVNSLLNKS